MKCSCGKKLNRNNKSGLCTKCFQRKYNRNYQKKYFDANPIKKEKGFRKLVKYMTHKTIIESENRLKDDPERLTVEFKHSYIDDIVNTRLKQIK